MQLLWSPWRLEYVTAGGPGDEDCFLCAALEGSDDAEHLLLHRGQRCFTILNKFPYNTGHSMVAPNRHVGQLEDLEPAESAELMELTTQTVSAIKKMMNPHGFNIGINLGQVAGAGLPGHVHVHVVPRWGGDTNFMPVVGETKVLPEALSDTYARLKPGFG
ncbi:MAG TPA: HIT domain-containing protein [Actinomycetota bacterium]|nr:HIT domain-containing protein [Actinomycetota bacterium]